MANLGIEQLHGCDWKVITNNAKSLSVQIHITSACDQNCIHCYLKKGEYREELSVAEWYKFIDELYVFLHSHKNKGGLISITGGDPLLSDKFWNLLEYIHERYNGYFKIYVMGNPYHVNSVTVERMKNLGVAQYQISLDGLKSTHDYYRREGSFEKSIEALSTLRSFGITTVVAMTISKTNSADLIPLLEYLCEQDIVDVFGFDKMIPIGNGEKMYDDLFSPIEYRQILLNVLNWEIKTKPKFEISKKDSLWKLLFWELGLTDPIGENNICSGCLAGISMMGIMPDGEMVNCPKLLIRGSKFPEISLRDFLKNNELAISIASREKNKKCRDCILMDYCGGCPAMRYATTGDIHGEEQYCWR